MVVNLLFIGSIILFSFFQVNWSFWNFFFHLFFFPCIHIHFKGFATALIWNSLAWSPMLTQKFILDAFWHTALWRLLLWKTLAPHCVMMLVSHILLSKQIHTTKFCLPVISFDTSLPFILCWIVSLQLFVR